MQCDGTRNETKKELRRLRQQIRMLSQWLVLAVDVDCHRNLYSINNQSAKEEFLQWGLSKTRLRVETTIPIYLFDCHLVFLRRRFMWIDRITSTTIDLFDGTSLQSFFTCSGEWWKIDRKRHAWVNNVMDFSWWCRIRDSKFLEKDRDWMVWGRTYIIAGFSLPSQKSKARKSKSSKHSDQ